MGGKRSKYGAIRTTIGGITFASKKEANHYSQLLLLLQAKIIRDLVLQPRYDIIVNGVKCGYYCADFTYYDMEYGKQVILDVKGVKTAIYRLKKKLVEAIYKIKITEV